MDDPIFYEQIRSAMAEASGRPGWFFAPADFKIAGELYRSGMGIRAILKAIEQASRMPSCRPDTLTLQFVYNFGRVAKYNKLFARSQEGASSAEPVPQQPQPDNIATHLQDLASRLQNAASSCPHRPVRNILAAAAASIDRISPQSSSLKVEKQLTEIQKTLDQQLPEVLSDQDHLNLHAAAQTALKNFCTRVTAQVYDQMLVRAVLTFARKKYKIPRLTLFLPK